MDRDVQWFILLSAIGILIGLVLVELYNVTNNAATLDSIERKLSTRTEGH